MYINHRIFTDIESYKVLSINGNTATCVPVKRVSKIKANFVPGGFVGTVLNNAEMFSDENSDIVECGDVVELVYKKHKGKMVWGCMRHNFYLNNPMESEEAADKYVNEINAANDGYGAEKSCVEGRWWVTVFDVTPKGKPRMRFEPYGDMSNECHYYYDFNF